MKKVFYLFVGVLSAILMFSCNKYLDVKPEDKLLSNEVFSSKQAVENALNGLYINMVSGNGNLYGANLSMTYIDILAQYYNISAQNSFSTTSKYNFTDNTAMGYATSIWNTSYNLILQDNQFINNLKNSTVLDSSEKQILLGEAFGLRAFLHLDLFRLFGPIYSSDSTSLTIPYKRTNLIQIDSFMTGNVFLKNLLLDLDTASALLKKDPIVTNGVVNQGSSDNFLSLRNRRFNYYASEALRARVLLYKGDKKNANIVAKNTIAEASQWFPFSAPDLSLPGIVNPDRSFSSEIIFCTENFDMYNQQLKYFSSSVTDLYILAPVPENLATIYEQNNNDFRYRVNWKIDASSSKSYPTFFKYADVRADSLKFRKLQPLIRMSELYYIVAETASSLTEATSYLNKIRNARGLLSIDLTSEAMRTSEVFKEYRKEFWGEGQLFFYYKRNNYSSILGGNSTASISMKPINYKIPIPRSETDFR